MGSHRFSVPSVGPKPNAKQLALPSTLSKERQKRDYCKAYNLCYYCAEPFDPTHLAKCTKRSKTHVNTLVLNDLNVTLTDEVLEHLAVEEAIAEEFCSLSINAISGTDIGEALKIKALLKNKVMLILVDSGSSHNFVSSSFLAKANIQPTQMKPKTVKVANRDMLIIESYVPDLEWWAQGLLPLT